MKTDSRILVTGHNGLVGRALLAQLGAQGFGNVVTFPRQEVDLKSPTATRWAFSVWRPEFVFHCAARVGGIQANIDDPLGFSRDNLAMQDNVFSNAAHYGVKRLVFLGSSCIYPHGCQIPMKEEYLMTGPFTPEVEAYGLAKMVGVKQCGWYRKQGHDFIAALPCNLFGPHDNFNSRTAHVIPGLIARMHAAKQNGEKEFKVWGNGFARREFLYSKDAATILMEIMSTTKDLPDVMNVGSGIERQIMHVAYDIAELTEFKGKLIFDNEAPVGASRKVLDISRQDSLSPDGGGFPLENFHWALDETYRSFLAGDGRK
jgi:GDP-L-fucose synthase